MEPKLINRQFQALLAKKGFPMKNMETDDSFVYKARLQISEQHIVDFAVSISKNEEQPVAQIVFNNVAMMPYELDRTSWLEAINKLNLYGGLYYYFGVNLDNTVFARYVTRLAGDVDSFFDVLSKGGQVVRNAISFLRDVE